MCAVHAVTAVKSKHVLIHRHRNTAHNLTMGKCVHCGKIKHFSNWLHLDEIADKTVRENLSWLIVTEAVNWNFMHCPNCAPS